VKESGRINSSLIFCRMGKKSHLCHLHDTMDKSVRKKIYIELFGLMLVAAISAMISQLSLDGNLIIDEWKTPLHYAVTAALSLIIYFLSRCLLPSFISSLLTISILFVLYYCSYYKAKLTKFPISFNDVMSLDAIAISLQFITYNGVLFIYLHIFILLLYLIYYNYKIGKLLFFKIVVLMSFMFCLYILHIYCGQQIIRFLQAHGVTYNNWDSVDNFNENGLFIHLLQTSSRTMPEKPTIDQKVFYRALQKRSIIQDHPKNMIMILCESCWYDHANFEDAFSPLFKINPVRIRGFSPLFGGGTPNATFEMITGLPVIHPAIYGIFYQEYGEIVSNDPDTIPNILSLNGINTYSLHNFKGSMYKRSIVDPKMGFQRFVGLDKMINDDQDEYFPRDYVLYNTATDIMNGHHDDSLFLHLATVHSHGPYNVISDDEYANYRKQISDTAYDAAKFIKSIMDSADDTVVLLYGDHKPPFRKFFEGMSSDELGDVPVLLFDKNIERRNRFAQAANGKPFYCYASIVSQIYYGLSLPASHFTQRACNEDNLERRRRIEVVDIPQWVYDQALFPQ